MQSDGCPDLMQPNKVFRPNDMCLQVGPKIVIFIICLNSFSVLCVAPFMELGAIFEQVGYSVRCCFFFLYPFLRGDPLCLQCRLCEEFCVPASN